MWKRTVLSFVSLLFTITICSQTINLDGTVYKVDTIENHQIGPATQYIRLRLTTPIASTKRLEVYFLVANLTDPNIDVRAAIGRDSIYGGERPSTEAKRLSTEGAFYYAGTNGDFFDTGATYTGYPTSGNMINGEIAKIPGSRHVYAIDAAKKSYIGTTAYAGYVKFGTKSWKVNSINHTRAENELKLYNQYNGKYTGWMNINGEYIRKTADTEEIIIVSPDGGYSSWYYDVPGDTACQYETYIASELIRWIDRHYSTVQSPKGRGITGLSMGGHGALFLAFRHPDVFGIAGSMSGGVDIRPFPLNWDLAKRLGSYAEHPENWEKNTVINLTYLLTSNTLKIIIDCGTEDFFYTVNKNLHQKLLENNIPHDFISRPGKHDSAYWSNAIQYQLLFMVKSFRQFQIHQK